METVTIRPATLDDAPALAETVVLGFESYRAWAPSGWEPPPPHLHLVGIRERLADPGVWCALAEAGGETTGHVAFTPARAAEEPRDPLPGLAHLWMLFVREPWWGTGVAADLLARATAEAAGRGYESIRLLTPAGHARARGFYEREGWRPVAAPAYEPALGLDLVEYRRPLAVPAS
ncbi:MAG: GNAT family N-acetyltransferase [Solirubrobacteraceae bacterium]